MERPNRAFAVVLAAIVVLFILARLTAAPSAQPLATSSIRTVSIDGGKYIVIESSVGVAICPAQR